MRFRGLDLNALVALNVLFEERSVTAAAKRMFISQSAMSGVLAKLRQHFGDPLLETAGRRLIVTPFGKSLVEPLRETMRHLEMLAGASVRFEPSQSHRTFSIVASDYLIGLVIPRILPAILADAPDIRIALSHPNAAPEDLLHDGDVDLVVTPEGFIAAPYHAEHFYEEDHVVIGCATNPIMAASPTLDDIASARHIVVRFGHGDQTSFAERELTRLGAPPRVAIFAATFSSVPALVLNTSLVSIVHRRLANAAARTLPLAVRELPVVLPMMRQTMLFHPLRKHDVGLAWLRTKLRDGIASEDASAPQASR
ncbi:MAG TPA: LysR substrate-binding domain-containing protein [Sphingomonas sp.]|nr:LysR substrate-binding domain-containing protein [Sphingomonas sp.]